MEDRYNIYSQGSSGWTTMRNEEFQEHDVLWGVFAERHGSQDSKSNLEKPASNFLPKRLPAATRMIPVKSSSQEEPKLVNQLGRSAPVNVPDWSKIYGSSSGNYASKNSWLDPDSCGYGNGPSHDEISEDEDDEGGNVIPPHEWITRRTQLSSFSVCEGAGRTLKGRDLSRVRNAVLTKTGFLESELSNHQQRF